MYDDEAEILLRIETSLEKILDRLNQPKKYKSKIIRSDDIRDHDDSDWEPVSTYAIRDRVYILMKKETT